MLDGILKRYFQNKKGAYHSEQNIMARWCKLTMLSSMIVTLKYPMNNSEICEWSYQLKVSYFHLLELLGRWGI